MRWLGSVILVAGLCLAHSISLRAEDWSSCASDLDSLRRAARDASEAAERAESERDEYENNKRELEDCLNYPKMHDLMGDKCQSLRWDYDSARSSYRSALSTLDSELDTVRRRYQSVQSSCALTAPGSGASRSGASKGKSLCDLYRQYKGSLPIKTLMDMCRQNLSQEECKRCLEIP